MIQALSPVVLKGGDATHGKEIFKKKCAKCHTHSGEGGKVGPDLTGMAAHPKSELIVHILDPSRSVEGNFLQYTVSTTEGRVLTGLLAGETKTSIDAARRRGQEADAPPRGHRGARRVEEVDHARGVREVGPAGGHRRPLAVPHAEGEVSAAGPPQGRHAQHDRGDVPSGPGATVGRLVFEDWGPKVVDGVPFALVDPQGDRVPNAILLGGPSGRMPPKMPKSVSLPVNAPARAIHFLSGVAVLGYPVGREGTVSMIVRIQYDDGTTEDHELQNGVHFADVNGGQDVPGSKLAFRLGRQQVRYLTVTPGKKDTIAGIELVKGRDRTAPIVLAATVEGFE